MCVAQQDTIIHPAFEKQLKMIQLLSDTQQYSEALRKLNALEDSKEIKKSIANEVEYRLMEARVLRLSGKFDDAMRQINMLPSLKNNRELQLRVDFRKGALYIENPKYSMEERIVIVYPIIERGIASAKKLNKLANLASFYNLKASMHKDECTILQRNCKKNRDIARELYEKSMNLFLVVKDTLNYHNVLNGLFRLAIDEYAEDVDSLKKLVDSITDKSSYSPNKITSYNLLGAYYLHIKKDSVNFLLEFILSKDESLGMIYKNRDNMVNKMKVLYEFDSLKTHILHNNEVLGQKDLVILEKNKSIVQNIVFSIVLGTLVLILIVLFLKQRRLAKKMNVANSSLQQSNHNFELLIKESNHRIKNNLQMILSIIALDKENTNHVDKQLLSNISSKILTITALHKILNFKEHNQKVALQVYFGELVESFDNLSQNGIIFLTDFANPKIQSERIIYFGLVLNELISNTIKHRKVEGGVIIQVLKSDDKHIFIYRDNSDFGVFIKNNGIVLIEDLITRFGGTGFNLNPKTGEYKFYFDE